MNTLGSFQERSRTGKVWCVQKIAGSFGVSGVKGVPHTLGLRDRGAIDPGRVWQGQRAKAVSPNEVFRLCLDSRAGPIKEKALVLTKEGSLYNCCGNRLG